MDVNSIETIKTKPRKYSLSKTPTKNSKIKFNNTIDIPNSFKTSKNININFKSFTIATNRRKKFNKTIKENNIESMNKILGKLTSLNTKLNEIKIRRKRNLKLLKLDKPKPKIMCKSETKNKYLLFINDYYKNKLLLKKKKLEKVWTEEERNDNYNRFLNPDFLSFENVDNIEFNNNESSKHTKLEDLITIDNDLETKNENEENNNNSSSKIKSKNNSKYSNRKSNFILNTKHSHKNSINFEDLNIPKIIPQTKEKSIRCHYAKEDKKNNNDNNISNSFIIYQDHINYIRRIRENELLDLINRYKKSMQKNQLEEISHFQRYVFPQELINYLIKMKKELIIDKFRAEYLNKLERYNLNNILHLKTSKSKPIFSQKK